MITLNSKIPDGPLAEKWTRYKASVRLVSPANRKKIDIIVVGTGLSGAAAASALGELGYNVKVFCYQDSPRRAHSVAAQGGINAVKNYQNDGEELREEFWNDLKIPEGLYELNQELEKAGRVTDFLELAGLLITDALNRKESFGAHFRSGKSIRHLIW
jgi:succinate dehydrogenase/fumarate reductase flavoprotein subunit